MRNMRKYGDNIYMLTDYKIIMDWSDILAFKAGYNF